jgi:hypothetical protein
MFCFNILILFLHSHTKNLSYVFGTPSHSTTNFFCYKNALNFFYAIDFFLINFLIEYLKLHVFSSL